MCFFVLGTHVTIHAGDGDESVGVIEEIPSNWMTVISNCACYPTATSASFPDTESLEEKVLLLVELVHQAHRMQAAKEGEPRTASCLGLNFKLDMSKWHVQFFVDD